MNIRTNPVRGVTGDNYVDLAKAFIAARKGGFVIALRQPPGHDRDKPFVPTLRQWGAWMAYYRRLDLKTRFKERLGYATMPAEWPHEFDTAATIQGDHVAADAFERHLRNERESATFRTGGIARQASKAIAMWNQTKAEQRQPTPSSHLDPTAGASVDFSDFPAAGASREELQAWDARQKVME